ncbi:restriction endonuclease subunit S [Pseudomonas lactis]|uniref:Restriction endonuclease subunit S n=1 Tax=Pseudomonas lactis TaxID=1615674 RepID=A0ABS9FRM0_9PSED|nr:restriction endonuclease subunit S [Pseudomonas lactis]MBI6974576.1 restriction endonuclease subunit S [Pseudomonas lactis]MCF4974306.1 restriction endonuclease subunit S [Pseudomonas lactis]MCF5002123.1 restriction endonuclease subunit S [Pseudomonas lactis]MCF5006345.1 restriction endonuclease subunit S [Pseudomonas lactis]MCF5012942.1 restriction endonuclease subunit S [Pseudomonas lactis]
MATWPVKRMDELCEITSSKRIFAADYVSEGVPFYRGREITEKYKGNLDVSTELFITEEKFREIDRKFGAPRQGDLLLTSVGTLGSVYVVKPSDRFYFKDGNLTWFRNFKGLNSQFLYYWIGSPQGKAELKKCTIGSSQSAFTIVLLKGIEIELPPPAVQQRIADILSAYDELIENSQRRIKTLESMVRALYREWFVHFRFPGHESIPRITSSLGEIPQGWEVRKLGNLAEEMRRNVRKGKLEEEQPYVGLEHIPRRSLTLDAWEETNELGSNKLEFKKGEILFGKIRPYFHKVSIAPFDGLCSADTIVIRARQLEYYAIVVSCVSSDEFVAHATATSNGSKMPRANWHVLEEYPVVIPTVEVARQFSAVIEPSIRQMQALVFQTINLRRTRDLLLPRLLSGQINVDPSA